MRCEDHWSSTAKIKDGLPTRPSQLRSTCEPLLVRVFQAVLKGRLAFRAEQAINAFGEPLLDEIQAEQAVQSALKAKSDEKRRDNSFALGVLKLNLVDPAMGSGHFLVRATEWLAEQIVYHPTTRLMTEQVVHTGPARRTREEILKAGKVPVPPKVGSGEPLAVT